MEEFLLRGVLTGDKLNIVNQKQVGAAVFVAEFKVFTVAHGFDEFVGKLVALDVDNAVIRMLLLDAVGDGIEQVRFPEAGLAVDEKRVIGVRALLRHGLRRGKGVLIRRADHEGIEGILGIEFHKVAPALVHGVLGKLVLVQYNQFHFCLKQLLHGLLDQLFVAVENDVLAKGGRGIDDKLRVAQLDDFRVVKKRRHGHCRGVLLQIG